VVTAADLLASVRTHVQAAGLIARNMATLHATGVTTRCRVPGPRGGEQRLGVLGGVVGPDRPVAGMVGGLRAAG
jgi:hypothetical protein